MFTQCPECQIAFRVTAKILQQAAGNVRCGNCNYAFNALHYLSEEMPAQLTDEVDDAISDDDLAETSRRLLQTLDELAGPEDVRIEDTGVEWRVLGQELADTAGPVLTEDAADEPRYDDETGIYDVNGGDDDDNFAFFQPAAPQRRNEDFIVTTEEFEDRQQDLALSNPEDWTDLLDEVLEPDAASFEIEEELAAIHSQLSSREERGSAAPALADLDTQFETQAEALGLEFANPEDELTDEVPHLDASEIALLDHGIELSDEADADRIAASDHSDTGISSLDDGPSYDWDDEASPELEPTGEFEAQIDVAARALSGESLEEQTDGEELADAGEWHDDEIEDALNPDEVEDFIDDDEDEDEAEEHGLADEEIVVEPTDADEPLAAMTEHAVPEPTAEEMTINMEIDEELMAVAEVKDDLSATIIGLQQAEQLFDENSDEVETIIMEGEFVRSAVEKERLAAENAARSEIDDPARLADTYAVNREKLRGGRRRYDPPSYGMIAAAILLSLVLTAQLIHNSRQSLATIGLFNQTIAPLYRVLGNPVTPEWDVKGWQFEATNGSVGADETNLTIVTRIGNKSAEALPYPLIHVSLTNRFEDIMGSRVLEPGEYLAGDIDPSRPVQPAENFTAVITIEEPAPDATGFKLNVCYRVEPGTVRCAIEDFKR